MHKQTDDAAAYFARIRDRDSALKWIQESQAHYIDARALKCPEPLMLLQAKITELEGENALVALEAQDAGTLRDIPEFCRFLDYDLWPPKVVYEGSCELMLFVIFLPGTK